MPVYLSCFLYDADSPSQLLLLSFSDASFSTGTIAEALLGKLEDNIDADNPFTQHLSGKGYYNYSLGIDFKPTTKDERLAEIFAGSIASDVLRKELNQWIQNGEIIFQNNVRIDQALQNSNSRMFFGIQMSYTKRVLFSDSFQGL